MGLFFSRLRGALLTPFRFLSLALPLSLSLSLSPFPSLFGVCLFGLLSFNLRKTTSSFLGCKLSCCWFSTVGFLVCSHAPLSFALSLSLSFCLFCSVVSFFRVSLRMNSTSHHFQQLGLHLSLLALLAGCVPSTEAPESPSVPWLFCVSVFRLLCRGCGGLCGPSLSLSLSLFLSFSLSLACSVFPLSVSFFWCFVRVTSFCTVSCLIFFCLGRRWQRIRVLACI